MWFLSIFVVFDAVESLSDWSDDFFDPGYIDVPSHSSDCEHNSHDEDRVIIDVDSDPDMPLQSSFPDVVVESDPHSVQFRLGERFQLSPSLSGINELPMDPSKKPQNRRTTHKLHKHIAQKCCEEKCLHNFSQNEVLQLRKDLYLKSFDECNQLLIALFNSASKDNHGKWIFTVKMKQICSKAFKEIYALTKYKFKSISRHAREHTLPVHGNVANNRSSEFTKQAIDWIQTFIVGIGEEQPDSGFIHLPSYLDKLKLYNEMSEELQQKDEDYYLSPSQFYNIWNEEFNHVKIPAKTRLGRCNLCTQLQTRKSKIKTPEELKAWKEEKTAHLEAVARERRFLNQRKVTAAASPEEYHHIIIDGMTMMYLPNVQPIPKGSSQSPRMKYHVTGIIDHSFNKRSLYFTPYTLEGGSNLTSTVILDHLIRIRKDHLHSRHLQIQADNCFRENKNTYMFGLAALLVHHRIYETVTLSMLIPGHTHEDIDQMFSVLSKYYWSHSLETLEDIEQYIAAAYKNPSTRPDVIQLSWIWDFKSLLEKCLVKMSNHSKPRYFHFKMFNGDAKMVYKTNNDDQWQGFNPESLTHIQLPIQVLKSVPSNAPNILKPTELPEDFVRAIQQESFWKSVISEESMEWWESCISDPTLGSEPSTQFSFASLGFYVPPPSNLPPRFVNRITVSTVSVYDLFFMFSSQQQTKMKNRNNKSSNLHLDFIQSLLLWLSKVLNAVLALLLEKWSKPEVRESKFSTM